MTMERGVRKGLVRRIVEHVAWRLFISVVYITGLTMLIPFIFFVVFPSDLGVVSSSTPTTLVWTAASMIIISFFVTLAYQKSLGRSLKALGRVTFIPGLIGLVFSMFGRDLLLLYFAGTNPAFVQIKQLIELYIDTAVPRVRYLTFAFFVLGMVLWLVGDKLETDELIMKARHTH